MRSKEVRSCLADGFVRSEHARATYGVRLVAGRRGALRPVQPCRFPGPSPVTTPELWAGTTTCRSSRRRYTTPKAVCDIFSLFSPFMPIHAMPDPRPLNLQVWHSNAALDSRADSSNSPEPTTTHPARTRPTLVHAAPSSVVPFITPPTSHVKWRPWRTRLADPPHASHPSARSTAADHALRPRVRTMLPMDLPQRHLRQEIVEGMERNAGDSTSILLLLP